MGGRDEREFLDFASSATDGMCRTAYLMCGDWYRAADLTQEALIRLYVAWPRLDKLAGLYRYARQTVVTVAIDAARRRGDEVPGSSATVDRRGADSTSQVDERMLLMEALAELPTRQRACVVLRYYEDLGVDEVASALGCRPGTVRSQTAQGLEGLRQSFARQGEQLRTGPRPAREATRW
jgi:RNA polymerase sigma-70 factor (sigma-E family)